MNKIFFALCLLGLIFTTDAHAKAYFSGKKEMIEKADVIAVIEIKDIKSLEPEKAHGNQQAKVVPVEVLKGTLVKEEALFIPCFFPCAIVKLTPGKYLVFLERTKEKKLQGFNWHLSYRPITGKTVEWYSGERTIEQKEAKLEGAIKEIKALVKRG